MKIPLYKASISGKEIALRVSRFLMYENKLSRGEISRLFERKFAEYVNFKYAVCVNSGTSALHLAVRALRLKRGDEVITTAFSYIASVNCLTYEGVIPVFVDIDPHTLNIDIQKIETKITSKTKAILIVDIFGLPVGDRRKIKKIKLKYNLKIIEDACEAVGRPTQKFCVGQHADIVVYGFHENKQMTTGGEGGMVVTNNKGIYNSVYSMANQGFSKGKNWVTKVQLGYNYRMTEIQALLGIEQLKNIDRVLKKRKEISESYYSFLPKNICPQSIVSSERSWFYYFIFCSNSNERRKLSAYLLSKGISVATHYFVPLYKFPEYKKFKDTLPYCEEAGRKILTLPMYDSLTQDKIEYITKCINNFYS